MKKLLVMMALLASGSAFAGQPTILDVTKTCTMFATKATEYATRAHSLNKDQISLFEVIAQQDLDGVSSEGAKKTIAMLAQFAWTNREQEPVAVGMAIYEDCMKHSGIST